MISDRHLREEVVRALDAVTPPAPWLASAVAKSLGERSRPGRGKPTARSRFALPRRLSAAVAVALILLIAAAAASVLVLRAVAPPVPAHPSSTVAEYTAMVKTDYARLLALRQQHGDFCRSFDDAGCPATIGLYLALRQQWIDDLDRTQPPPQFAALHVRLRAILVAGNSDFNQELAAFNARDANGVGMAYGGVSAEADALDRLAAYVMFLGNGGSAKLDPASARYSALVARDYDNLHLATTSSSLVSCKLTDAACPTQASTLGRAIRALRADLQAAAPPSRFASRVPSLLVALDAEARVLDDLSAAYVAGDPNLVWLNQENMTLYETQINLVSSYILYPV